MVDRRRVCKAQGLTCDQHIHLQGKLPQAIGVPALRRIGYRDPKSAKHDVFLTNIFHLSAKTIADLYKERWQIELFFKWIKSAQPQDQELPRHQQERRAHPNLCGALHVSATCLPEVPQPDRALAATDLALVATEPIRTPRPRRLIKRGTP